jgi:hypothetical protein
MVTTYLQALCTMLGMTTRKNHPSGLKRRSIKFSTMHNGILCGKLLNHCCLSLHDHFGEFLMGFAHSTKSWVVRVMWRSPIMRNHVYEDHITLQLKLKNHSCTIVLHLHPPKWKYYATTFYKYGDLINKFSHQKIS